MASDMEGLTSNVVAGENEAAAGVIVGAVEAFAPVGDVAGAAVEQAAVPSGKKSKPSPITGRKRSVAWDHFNPPVLHEDGSQSTKCKYCPKTYVCGSRGYGTSNMIGNFKICKKNPNIDRDANQDKLAFTPSTHGRDNNLAPWNFDKSICESGWGKF